MFQFICKKAILVYHGAKHDSKAIEIFFQKMVRLFCNEQESLN